MKTNAELGKTQAHPMKALAQILAPLVAALLGYAASGAFRAAGEKSHAAPATTPTPATTPGAATFSTQPEDPRMDAVGSVIARFAGEPSLADFASTLAAIERLSPAQVGELLRRTLTMRLPAGVSESDRTGRMSLLMRAWVQRDPQAATEWMRPRLERYARLPGFGSGYASTETELVDIWARNAPTLALEIARAHPRSELGYKLLWNAIVISEKDHARRFELLSDFPAGTARQRMVRYVCAEWAHSDFPAALAAIGSMTPDAERTEALRTMLPNSVGRDPAGTLAQAVTLGAADDPKTVLRLAMAAGDKAPWVTARWLEALGPEQLRSAGPALVLAWAKKEPATAFNWAIKHGMDIGASVLAGADTETRDWAFGQRITEDTPMQTAMWAKPEAVLGWLHAQPPGAARDTAVVQTLRAMRDEREMIPLLAMLPPDAAPQGAEIIAGRFKSLNSGSATEWAASLPTGPTRTAAWTGYGKAMFGEKPPNVPPGPDRDAMLRGMTQSSFYSHFSPERPMEHALEISDPALRQQTFDELMSGWVKNPQHRESAAPWLERAAIPQEWKARWRDELQ